MIDELEKDLVFRRWAPDKQEQIRQLVSYATLLGINGDGLVSIGNRLNRIALSRTVKENKKIAKELMVNVVFINDRNRIVYNHEGQKYSIQYDGWHRVDVQNMSSKRRHGFRINHYDVGTGESRRVYLMLLNIFHGQINLNSPGLV